MHTFVPYLMMTKRGREFDKLQLVEPLVILHGLRGSLSLSYILALGEVRAYLVLSLSTRGRLLGIIHSCIIELIRQNI